MNEIALTFPALPEYVGEVRAALEDFLRQAGIKGETVADLKAAVSEACANVVRYAYADDPGDMQICFKLSPQNITVTVTDQGRGFDTKNPPQRPLNDADIHLGMGLQLMRGMTDEMAIRSSSAGTIVTLVKKIKFL